MCEEYALEFSGLGFKGLVFGVLCVCVKELLQAGESPAILLFPKSRIHAD